MKSKIFRKNMTESLGNRQLERLMKLIIDRNLEEE